MSVEAAYVISPRYERRRRLIEAAMRWVFLGVGLLTIVLLVGIFVFLLVSGVQTFFEVNPLAFFFGTSWNPSAISELQWGIVPLFVGTAIVAIGALLIAVPFGMALAIYLSFIASRTSREILKPIIEMISGIPSVVLGLIGLLYLAPLIARTFNVSNGLTGLCAIILVAVTAVPTIASLCEDALSSVPKGLNEAGLAMGGTQWTTIRRILIPAASSGIAAAVMLGLGRAIGETMVVLMVAGNSLAMPHGLLDAVRPMTATIAIEIREVVVGDLHWNALFAVGLTLFILTFAINTLTDVFLYRRKHS